MLDYPYFKDSYKMIVVDLSKRQILDSDPGAIQKNNFIATLEQATQESISF